MTSAAHTGGLKAFAVALLFVMALLPGQALALDYAVRVDGLDDQPDLAQLILDASLLEQLREDGAPSLFALRRRATDDLERVQAALRSRGFYDGAATIEVEEPDAANPVAVIKAETGPLYTIGSVYIEGPDGQPLSLLSPDDQPLKPGQPALSSAVLEAEPAGLSALRGQGYAFATAEPRRVTVNHESRKMNVWFRYKPGPLVKLGKIRLSGLDQVEPVAVMRRIGLEEGETYSPGKLGGARGRINGLNTFSSVEVRLDEVETVPEGATEVTLPVAINVEERPARIIGGAVTASTDEGAGVEARWSHRNILGQAERLDIVANVGRLGAQSGQGIDYGLSANLSKPDFLSLDQTLKLGASYIQENPEAYERQAIELTAGLERPLFANATGTTAVKLAIEDVKDNDDVESEQFITLSFPNSLNIDTTDDILDPSKGYAVDILAEPVLSTTDPTNSYLITKVQGRAYWEAIEEKRLILAIRGGIGSILGSSTDNIPANRRFYAGGDGSVRGYADQSVGPRDSDNDPSGGRSLIELGTEARIRITEDIGIVPFVDAGIVTEESFVDFSETPRVGAGLGLRYFTGFGPLRVDFGVPLNPDDDDDAFEVYFSFGQAF